MAACSALVRGQGPPDHRAADHLGHRAGGGRRRRARAAAPDRRGHPGHRDRPLPGPGRPAGQPAEPAGARADRRGAGRAQRLRRAARHRAGPAAAARDRGTAGHRPGAIRQGDRRPAGRRPAHRRAAERPGAGLGRGPGQPGAHRRAEQHQPGLRGRGHPQGVPPGGPGPQSRPRGVRRARPAGRDGTWRSRSAGWRPATGDELTILAILSRYLRAASDGWSLAATSVRDLYAQPDTECGRGRRRLRRRGAPARHRDRRGAPGSGHRVRRRRSAARRGGRAGRADAAPAGRRAHRRPRAGRARGHADRGLRRAGRPGRAGAGAAHPRRLPPGPGDAHPDRVGDARLRGRARGSAGRPAGPLLAAARRGGHAPLVRLRGQAPVARPPGSGSARTARAGLGAAQPGGLLRRLRRGRRGLRPAQARGAAARLRAGQGGVRGYVRGEEPAVLAVDPAGLAGRHVGGRVPPPGPRPGRTRERRPGDQPRGFRPGHRGRDRPAARGRTP